MMDNYAAETFSCYYNYYNKRSAVTARICFVVDSTSMTGKPQL